MASFSSTPLPSSTPFQFASAVSRSADSEAAARDLVDAIRAKLGGVTPDLGCLFFSSHHISRANVLADMVVDSLGVRVCIGCSGEGVIAGAEELETAPAVTLWTACLPGVTLTPVRLSFSPTQDQFSLVGWPEAGGIDSTFLLFADPFTTPMQEVLSLLEERYPGTAALGGLSGGGQDAGENRLVMGREVYENGLVGVRISGPVEVRPVISQGCRPIGERYVVTKAEHNMVHELGGTSALDRLQHVFESLGGEDRQRAHRALHIGIVIDEHRDHFERGDFLVRNLVGADQTTGAVAIGDVVQEGQTVQFHLRDAKSASDDLNVLLAADRMGHRNPPLGALVFSCCGRGQGLFGRPHHDSGILAERLGGIPVAGFFAQGEIGPVGGRNFLHGYTASMALFAAPASKSGTK
ncbi:MAG: FIST N-terminal domain-containing protein [Nitrospira sp.]|jgi:small ligand-binding sensory domain FIST|nr:FIST N-terminal domain-containing protein [Nitrospira sp.]